MNNIKQLRVAMKLTQEELGKKINVRKSSISRYESEKIALQPDILNAMASFFKVSTDCILGRKAIPNGYPLICAYAANTAPSTAHSQQMPPSLSDEALEIARKYDRVDKRGQGNIKSVVDREYEMTIDSKMQEAGVSC